MNPWQLAFALLAAFGSGAFVTSCANAKRATDDRVALQNSLLSYNASALAAQKAEADRVIAVISAPDPVREATRKTLETLLHEVQLAPNTSDCVDSPAIQLVLDRLRQFPGPGGIEPDTPR